jgi:hypothetical protein
MVVVGAAEVAGSERQKLAGGEALRACDGNGVAGRKRARRCAGEDLRDAASATVARTGPNGRRSYAGDELRGGGLRAHGESGAMATNRGRKRERKEQELTGEAHVGPAVA